MKNLKTRGYVAVETVITAAIILLAGIFAIMNFSFSGNSFVHTLNERIAGLGIFGGSNDTPGETIVYDENGYPEHLNISLADVTPEANFNFVWDDANNGWGIESYLDDGRTSVIVPSRRTDGLPVVSILDFA